MRYLNAKIVLSTILMMVVWSCSSTKKVKEGEFLLTKNKFEFQQKDKPFKDELQDYVKQRPNRSLLFGLIPYRLMWYNAVPTELDTTFEEYYSLTKKNRNRHSLDSLLVKNGLEKYEGKSLWLKRFLYNSGEPPVIIDSSLSSFSEENLEKFYFDKGYFDAEVESSHDLDSTAKKGKVIYSIKPGEVSLINSYAYEISDSLIKRYYERMITREQLIKVGDRYDMDNFQAERDRIVEMLKNRGYYKFNNDGTDIEFTADTTQSDKLLDVTLLIPMEKTDSLPAKKYYRYRYKEIHLYPDSGPVRPGDDSIAYLDTIYNGYHLHYADPKMKFRPRFFTDAIVMRDSSLYRYNSEVQTKRNIFKREGINLLDYNITELDSTFIGEDKAMNLSIYFKPKKKYDLFYGAELSWSEFMNFGVSPHVSLVARNLFHGGENLETSIRGTLGNVNKKFTDDRSFFNAFEMAFQTKLKFPYLLTPFKTDSIVPKRYFKQTDLRIGATVQRNIGLGRVTYGTGIDYNLSFRDTQSHMISFLNTEFVKNIQQDNYFTVFEGDNVIKNSFFNNYYFMSNPAAAIQYDHGELTDDQVIGMIYNDANFLSSLDHQGLQKFSVFENMYFRKLTITQNVLISSLIYQYTFDGSQQFRAKNPWFLRGRIEVAGNVLNLMDKAFGFNRETSASGNETGLVFSVPYSQFVKLDIDVRKYFKITTNSTLATRGYFGIIQPYGNTDFIPFVRSYTAGGANDVRAWAAATLGPGDFPRYQGGDDVFAIERLKLLFSAEYRFKTVGIFNGALFVDAGNIWGTDKNNELTLFRFSDFYKELGIGGGFGLRLDITYFLIRLDLAYKLHDPSYPEGDRWRFNDFNILKPRLAIGINYPF